MKFMAACVIYLSQIATVMSIDHCVGPFTTLSGEIVRLYDKYTYKDVVAARATGANGKILVAMVKRRRADVAGPAVVQFALWDLQVAPTTWEVRVGDSFLRLTSIAFVRGGPDWAPEVVVGGNRTDRQFGNAGAVRAWTVSATMCPKVTERAAMQFSTPFGGVVVGVAGNRDAVSTAIAMLVVCPTVKMAVRSTAHLVVNDGKSASYTQLKKNEWSAKRHLNDNLELPLFLGRYKNSLVAMLRSERDITVQSVGSQVIPPTTCPKLAGELTLSARGGTPHIAGTWQYFAGPSTRSLRVGIIWSSDVTWAPVPRLQRMWHFQRPAQEYIAARRFNRIRLHAMRALYFICERNATRAASDAVWLPAELLELVFSMGFC